MIIILITEKVKIIPNPKIFKHYKDLGYDVKYNEELEVNVEDLTSKSHVKVEVKCDYCGENYFTEWYLYKRGRETILKDFCNNPMCKTLKQKDVLMAKYGVDNIRKIPGVNEKIIQTNLKKYGCENPQQNPIVKAKTEQTCLELYGDTNVLGGNSILREEIKEKQMEGKEGIGGGAFISKN